MDLMLRRRELFGMLGGDDLKKKTFHVEQQTAVTFSLVHNIGVLPKFIVILDDNVQTSIDDYTSGEIYYFEAAPVPNAAFQTEQNAMACLKNLESQRISAGTIRQTFDPSITTPGYYFVDDTNLRINRPITNSDWSKAPSYTVDIYY